VEQDYLTRSRTSSAAYARVVLNLSRCYYELQNFDKSADYADQLKELDPALLRQNSYLTEDGTATAIEG
jgi:tetratricopeptide (TPR) repeat protein